MDYVKVFAFIPRRKDVTPQYFHDHWRHPHATWGKEMRAVRRYVQHHQIYDALLGPGQDRFEGVAEGWFETEDDAAAFGNDPIYREHIGPDERRFIDRENLTYLAVREEVLRPVAEARDLDKPDTLWSPWNAAVTIKLTQSFLPTRKEQWWSSDDTRLGDELGALRHVRNFPISKLNPPEGARFVGIRELWWPTLSAFSDGVQASKGAWKALCEDQPDALLMLTQSEIGRNEISALC